MARDIFEKHLQDQARNWIQVACEHFATKSQSLQWDRSPAGKWIHNERGLRWMSGTDQLSCHLEVYAVVRHVPVGEGANKPEEALPQFLVALPSVPNIGEDVSRLVPELLGAVVVAGIGE